MTIDELFELVEKADVTWYLTHLGGIRCGDGLCPGEVALGLPAGEGVQTVYKVLGEEQDGTGPRTAHHFIVAADDPYSSPYRERLLKACKLEVRT